MLSDTQHSDIDSYQYMQHTNIYHCLPLIQSVQEMILKCVSSNVTDLPVAVCFLPLSIISHVNIWFSVVHKMLPVSLIVKVITNPCSLVKTHVLGTEDIQTLRRRTCILLCCHCALLLSAFSIYKILNYPREQNRKLSRWS